MTPQTAKTAPSAETGELGFQDGYDRAFLTITVGFAERVFDLLGTAADQRPQDLRPIDWVARGDEHDDRHVEQSANGDVLIQICSDDVSAMPRQRGRAGGRLRIPAAG